MAYAYQTFSVGQVLTAAQVQSLMDSIRDHLHGVSSVSDLAATQAELESASSVLKYSTPGRQQHHPGHPKAWLSCDSAGNINASYNITSITDTGTGTVTVTIATDFSSANICVVASGSTGGTPGGLFVGATTFAAGSFVIYGVNSVTQAAQDVSTYCAVCLGDQA